MPKRPRPFDNQEYQFIKKFYDTLSGNDTIDYNLIEKKAEELDIENFVLRGFTTTRTQKEKLYFKNYYYQIIMSEDNFKENTWEYLNQLTNKFSKNDVDDDDNDFIDNKDDDFIDDEDEEEFGNMLSLFGFGFPKEDPFDLSRDKDFMKLNEDDKKKYQELLNQIKDNDDKSMLMRTLELNTSIKNKKAIMNKYLNYKQERDNGKLKNWLDHALALPFNNYNTNLNEKKDANKLLKEMKDKMDKVIFGNNKMKEAILLHFAEELKEGKPSGKSLALYGPPGTGKTTLIKEGVANCLDRPFSFISLGGCSDASFLEGHSFTYEGSMPGKIVEVLKKMNRLDGIIYFDELDKVSKTWKGDEIINLLIHIIDPSQNAHFNDKYLMELDLDLSKITFIFSLNDLENVNHILLDRLELISTDKLSVEDKIRIGKKYLLPELLKGKNIEFNKRILKDIIVNYTYEAGVRNYKRILAYLIRKINYLELTNQLNLTYPYTLTNELYQQLMSNYQKIEEDTGPKESLIGTIKGLYATTSGLGGILPIQAKLIPSTEMFKIVKTGNLGTDITESSDVALSVALNYLGEKGNLDKIKTKLDKSKLQGIHLHYPDQSTPVDGPSAGLAMTLLFLSILTNKKINHQIAITGEVDLNGNALPIGGLIDKLEGAKRAGVKTVYYPKANQNQIDLILKDYPKLVDDKFKIQSIERVYEIIDKVLL